MQSALLNDQQRLKTLLTSTCGRQWNGDWHQLDNRHEVHRQCVTLYNTSNGLMTGIAAWQGTLFEKLIEDNTKYLYSKVISKDCTTAVFKLYQFPFDPMLPDLHAACMAQIYRDVLFFRSHKKNTANRDGNNFWYNTQTADMTIVISLLRYRPCLSCTLSANFPGAAQSNKSCISKVYSTSALMKRVHDVMKRLSNLQDETGRLFFATPITTIPDKSILVQNRLPGENLEEILMAVIKNAGQFFNTIPKGMRGILQKCGEAIHFVHNSGIRSGNTRPIITELSELQRKAENTCDINKEKGEELLALSSLLHDQYMQNFPSAEFVLTHGDFKPGQFLVSGSDVYLLDFDEAAMSSRFLDIGTFTATLKQLYLKFLVKERCETETISKQLTEQYIDCFLNGYFFNGRIFDTEIVFFQSLALLRKALREFYTNSQSTLISYIVKEAMQSLLTGNSAKLHTA